ncbi:MAG: glycerate kinase [Eubacteriales bacterium]|nr:glycerate kinase [Eubacteriales bacterium]
MNKIVICMDSFKGSLSSADACRAVSEGIRDSGITDPVIQIPVSDGGEGFADAFLINVGGHKIDLGVTGPYRKPVIAGYAMIEDGKTAVIEMAAASGLCLSERREPLAASSYGTGELIADALDRGVRRILLGLGGSATNDGGAGMLSALGVKFTGKRGVIRKPVAADLAEIIAADATDIHPGLRTCDFLVCCDVRNKLLGENGASSVFGPQKGASPEDVVFLDKALERYRDVLLDLTGRDISRFEGSGAAGGMAAGLYAFGEISIRPGIEVLLEMIGFEDVVKGAKLVFTGEGRVDAQTAGGKLPVGIARAVRKSCGDEVPVIALVGEMGRGYDAVYMEGITAVFSILHRAASFSKIKNDAFADLKDTAHNAARLLYNTKIIK